MVSLGVIWIDAPVLLDANKFLKKGFVMKKSNHKKFDWYNACQRFSIRKYHFGAASVLLGTALVLGLGAQTAQAEEQLAEQKAEGLQSKNTVADSSQGSKTPSSQVYQAPASVNESTVTPTAPATVDAPVKVDKSALNVAIIKAKKASLSDKTDASIQSFKQALANAEAILSNAQASQETVAEAVKSLTKAQDDLSDNPAVKPNLDLSAQAAPSIAAEKKTELAELRAVADAVEKIEGAQAKAIDYTVVYLDKQTGLEVWREKKSYTPVTKEIELDKNATITVKPDISAIKELAGYRIEGEQEKTLTLSPSKDNVIDFAVATVGKKRGVRETGSTSTVRDADKAIDQAAADAKKVIEAQPNLSADEKKAAQAKVDAAATAAKGEIAKATDSAQAQAAEDAGKKAIADVALAAAKTDADKAIDQAAADAKKAIEALPYLSQVDKDKAKVEVDQARDAAKAKVDQATDKAQVPSEVDKGQTAINNLVAAASAKQSAKGAPAIREELPEYQLPNTDEAVKALDQAAEDAKKAIDALPNLSNDEKTAAKQAVDQARVVAKENVSKTATVTELAKATDAGKAAIQVVVDGAKATDKANELAKAKSDAKQALDKAAEDAKKAIEAQPNLSADEKKAAQAEVDVAATAAKGEIAKATDPAQAQAAEDAGKKAIADVALAAAKADSDKAIDQVAADAKKAIEALPNLSAVEKRIAQARVGLAATLAKNKNRGTRTPAQAQAAGDEGKKAIADIALAAAKDDADKAKVSNSSKIADVTQAVTSARRTNQAIIERAAAIDSANENLRQQNRKDLEKKVVNELPNTGAIEESSLATLGIMGLLGGLGLAVRKRKED